MDLSRRTPARPGGMHEIRTDYNKISLTISVYQAPVNVYFRFIIARSCLSLVAFTLLNEHRKGFG